MTGRPSGYSDAIAQAICDHMAEGGLLVTWCRAEGRPGLSTVYRWMEQHEAFREAYARAREVGLHVMAEEVIAISDDSASDWRKGEGGEDVLDHEHVQRSKLRVDSRKWLTSKLAAKFYGDRQQHEHSGPGGGPITVVSGVRREGE